MGRGGRDKLGENKAVGCQLSALGSNISIPNVLLLHGEECANQRSDVAQTLLSVLRESSARPSLRHLNLLLQKLPKPDPCRPQLLRQERSGRKPRRRIQLNEVDTIPPGTPTRSPLTSPPTRNLPGLP